MSKKYRHDSCNRNHSSSHQDDRVVEGSSALRLVRCETEVTT